MRLIQEIPHEEFKISVFSWNNKYLIKFENHQFEQTYKVNEWDLTGEQDIVPLVNELIIKNINEIFIMMNKKISEALDNI